MLGTFSIFVCGRKKNLSVAQNILHVNKKAFCQFIRLSFRRSKHGTSYCSVSTGEAFHLKSPSLSFDPFKRKRDPPGKTQWIFRGFAISKKLVFHFKTDFYFRLSFQTCFVQMRKKEPPHPIRVAKTIDVIAR